MPPLKLEIFDMGEGADLDAATQSLTEEARLSVYEEGYSAGWEDAVAAEAAGQERLGADLARHLQDLGFTYQEARIHVLRMVEPLLEQVVTKLLPRIAHAAIAPVVAEALMPMAEQLSEAPLHLVVNPTMRERVETRLSAMTSGLPLIVVAEPTLGEGQAYLRLGEAELRVDLDQAIARISDAVHGFFELSRTPPASAPVQAERAHG